MMKRVKRGSIIIIAWIISKPLLQRPFFIFYDVTKMSALDATTAHFDTMRVTPSRWLVFTGNFNVSHQNLVPTSWPSADSFFCQGPAASQTANTDGGMLQRLTIVWGEAEECRLPGDVRCHQWTQPEASSHEGQRAPQSPHIYRPLWYHTYSSCELCCCGPAWLSIHWVSWQKKPARD